MQQLTGSDCHLDPRPEQLERKVKNVITALAKTHHYWQEHLHG